MTNIFANQPEVVTGKFIESSFPSVKKTMLHIWDAELIWLKRLQKEVITDFPSKYFVGITNEVINGLQQTSIDFRDFVEEQDDNFFLESFTVKTLTSGTYTQKAFEMIHHCMNHSTYHRGQLLMMARQLGLQNLVSTDLIFYLREKE